MSPNKKLSLGSPDAGVAPHSWKTRAWLLCVACPSVCVCMHMSPCSLPPEAGATLISETSCAETDPAWLISSLPIKRPTWWDNRVTVADSASMLALRLHWWRCALPLRKEPTRSLQVLAQPCFHPPSSQGPDLSVLRSPRISYLNFFPDENNGSISINWLGAAQDVPPPSSIPSPCPCPQQQHLKAVVAGCGLAVLCRPSETALSQPHYCNIFSTQEAKEASTLG